MITWVFNMADDNSSSYALTLPKSWIESSGIKKMSFILITHT